MKRLIPLFLLMLLQFPVMSQETGFGGKRFVIKTDILNGTRSPLYSLSAELLVSRRLTLTAGFRITSGKYKQIYYHTEYKNFRDGYSYTTDTRLPDKATINSRTLTLEGRFYLNEGVIPAPKGSFFYGSYNYGKVDVKGNYYETLFNDNVSPNQPNSPVKTLGKYYDYKANNITVWGFELGYGYQTFLTRWLTCGFKLGINKTFFNSDEKWDPYVLSGVAKTYGPNLLRLVPNEGIGFDYLVPSATDNDAKVYKGSVGMSFYLQLGIILF